MRHTALHLLTILSLAISATAAEKHDHKHDKRSEGPNGGRVITSVEPHLEFLAAKGGKVEITALTEDLKPAKWAGQVVSVTAGDRSKPTKLELKEENGKLISTNTLPEGSGYPVSVSIKPASGGKTVYEKFNLDLSKCPTCKYQEYACTCEHAADTKKK